MFYGLDVIYLLEALIIDPLSVRVPPDILDQVAWYLKITLSYLGLTWAAIFAVKFGFLHFFRSLVDPLPGMIWYWKIVVGINIAVFAFASSVPYIICPHVDSSASEFNLRKTEISSDYALCFLQSNVLAQPRVVNTWHWVY